MWEAAPAFLVSKQQRAAPLRDAALFEGDPAPRSTTNAGRDFPHGIECIAERRASPQDAS